MPAIDVSQTPEEVRVKAELPGIDPKEIDITVEGDLLTLKGERKQEKEDKGEDYHLIERYHGTFSRTLRLPEAAETDKINATYKDGVLRLTIPKRKEAQPKKIEVTA
jgi:HSP20 family protein